MSDITAADNLPEAGRTKSSLLTLDARTKKRNAAEARFKA